MASRNEKCVAIDLGTTNSLIASVRIDGNKITTPVRNVRRNTDTRGSSDQNKLLPSFVYYPDDKTGKIFVGDFAKKQYSAFPYRVAQSIKSQMGQQKTVGLQDGICDTTPEAVSSRIIKHLIDDLNKYYDEEISDVVITVPASFNAAQSLATLRAAEMAGIDVRLENGEYDNDILLSEPEAVMYDVLNQLEQGEYDAQLSFDTKKTVMVYDIGGGTLDITLHTVERNKENPNILDFDMIATNRYTPVAGDNFDNAVAEKMFDDFVSDYQRQSPAAAQSILSQKDKLFKYFPPFAESVKIELNELYSDRKRDHRMLSDQAEIQYGGNCGQYQCDNFMTKAEFEDCIRPLMGEKYKYNDYKTIENVEQTDDIIWPVLDVLRKGAKKLGVEDIKLDAVIISGGMSKLYAVQERLERFFGFHVYSSPDPDSSVVKGAVVYHYYQHKESDLMHRLHNSPAYQLPADACVLGSVTSIAPEIPLDTDISYIRQGKTAMSETMYLGLKGGAKQLLIEEGADLPYESDIISGLGIEKGQQTITIPIQCKGKSEYVTIASGQIEFKQAPAANMFVSIKFRISNKKIITLEADMYKDENNMNFIEKGVVTIVLGDDGQKSGRGSADSKPLPPPGSKLNACNEVSIMLTRCKKNYPSNSLKTQKSAITSCSNPEDFAEPLLKTLELNMRMETVCFHFIPLARRLSKFWTPQQKSELVRICRNLILPVTQGFSSGGKWNSVYGEAIKTIALCGTDNDVLKLAAPSLTGISAYRTSLMYAFGLKGVRLDWINSLVKPDCVEAYFWIGIAVRNADTIPDNIKLDKTIDALVNAFYTTKNENLKVNCIASLGFICQKKNLDAGYVSNKAFAIAEDTVESANEYMFENQVHAFEKFKAIALKLMRGGTLDFIEEQYLLSRIGDM